MSKLSDELTVLINKFDMATNAVADEIRALKVQIADLLANPNEITPEQATEIETKLQATVDRLNALGAAEADPIPGEKVV